LLATSDIVVENFILVNIDLLHHIGTLSHADGGSRYTRTEAPMVSRRQSIQEAYGVSDCKLSDKIPIVKIFPSKMHIIFSFVQFFHYF